MINVLIVPDGVSEITKLLCGFAGLNFHEEILHHNVITGTDSVSTVFSHEV